MDVYKKAWKLLAKKLEEEKPKTIEGFERLMGRCLIEVRSEVVNPNPVGCGDS